MVVRIMLLRCIKKAPVKALCVILFLTYVPTVIKLAGQDLVSYLKALDFKLSKILNPNSPLTEDIRKPH